MADYLVWDPSKYGLGVEAMDREHEHLIGLMNTVHDLHVARATRAALAKAVEALIAYTRKHFADEEAYLERIGYPGLRVHAGVHRQLLARLTQFTAEFEKSGVLKDDFFMFLSMWLRAHICGIDAKYAAKARVA